MGYNIYDLVLSDIILIYLVRRSFDGSLQDAQFSLKCTRSSSDASGDLTGTLFSQISAFMNRPIYFIRLYLYMKLFQDVGGAIGSGFYRYTSRNIWYTIV